MHPEQAAFESNIDENPEDATNHLVYADWLDEHDQPEEAAFRRSMGRWVQDAVHRRPAGKLRAFSAGNTEFPYPALPLHVPEGVDGGQILTWQDPGRLGPGPGSVFLNGAWRPQDPTHALYNYGVLRWQTYRNMEEAFRRNFMENLKKSQSQKMSRRVYARRAARQK